MYASFLPLLFRFCSVVVLASCSTTIACASANALAAPAPLDYFPLHADGGLIYDPLSREAKATGQLSCSREWVTETVRIEQSGLAAVFEVPVVMDAYAVVPIRYTISNLTKRAIDTVHLAATAFEEIDRRGDRHLTDLSLPGRIALEPEYLGYVTARNLPLDALHRMLPDRSDTPVAQYPGFEAQPLRRSGTLETGDLLWYKFRFTNTGNTILSPEGIGAFFFYPVIQRMDKAGKWVDFGIHYNRYIRIKEYLYPGESVDLWFQFMTDDSETPQGFGLLPGEYRILLNGVARFEREFNWEVNLWAGRQVFSATWPFSVEENARMTEPQPVTVAQGVFEGRHNLNQWLHNFEEFMTAFQSRLDGLAAGETKTGTLHLQMAPWSEQVVVKLINPNQREPATAAVPVRINEERPALVFEPNKRNIVWHGNAWRPFVFTQAMPDMRASFQLGPDPAATIRRDLENMRQSGITAVGTTAMPWLYEFIELPYIHSQPTMEANHKGDAYKFFLDAARAVGMPVEGWGNYPFARRTVGEVASWLLGKPFELAAAFPMEASKADPNLPRANALMWKYHFERWGDNFFVNAAGEMPFGVEDTRGWLRMDLHIRYPMGELAMHGFADWLRERYESLAELNQAWGSDYSDWNEIHPEKNQSANRWGHRWEYFNRDHVFHDWSPAIFDFDAFRTELRLKNYADTLYYLRKEIPDATLNVRTEGANVIVSGLDPMDSNPRMRHIYYSQHRAALIAEAIMQSGLVAYHSDYITLPYSPSEVSKLTAAAVAQGITPAWLPQFNHMRDIAFNERYGTSDYYQSLNGDKPMRAAMMHVLTAVYPWWKAVLEAGGVPGILWQDFECDGIVTDTQLREMRLFNQDLQAALQVPTVRAKLEAIPPPNPSRPKSPMWSFGNYYSSE